MKPLGFLITVGCMLLLLTTGCNNTQEAAVPAYETESAATIRVGDVIPPPTNAVILTVRGGINGRNVDGEIQFDMETLEALGTVSYTVEDKQAEGETVTFEGVLVSDIMAAVQIDESAETLHTIALNDYAVDIPVEDIDAYPVLLATRVNGERMAVERYGPTRIIYPYHAFEMDVAVYDPRWIWQLAVIEVR